MRGTNGSNTFAANDARVELLRAVDLCHPGWTNLRGLTFSPDAFSSPVWTRWKEGLFVEIIVPRLEEARCASASGDWRFLAECDRAIDAALPAAAQEASVRAGRELSVQHGAPKSERLLGRYQGLIDSGGAPGHLAILCALRGAIFHLCPAIVLGAYVFLEAKGGLPGSGIEHWVEMVEDCLSKRGCAQTSNLRAA